jgi:4-hydroxy-3-methylbut-2-enyl diphosphate reductase
MEVKGMAVTEERITNSVEVAEHAGFCSGVRRSLLGLDELMRNSRGRPVYFREPMVHDEKTMEPFYRRGLQHYDGNEVPADAMFVVSAHGASPKEISILEEKGFTVHNPMLTTCPLVLRFQANVQRMSNTHRIVIFGDLCHPEIKGVVGFVETCRTPIVIDSIEKARTVPIESTERVAVFCQTTRDKSDFAEVCETLRRKNSNIEIFDTVCPSVAERVLEARELAGKVELMVVLGSRTSANALNLERKVREVNNNTAFVQGADADFNETYLAGFSLDSWFRTAETIGLTASASASQEAINELDEAINRIRLAA